MTGPEFTRLTTDLPGGGQARVWLGLRWAVLVLPCDPPLVVPPRVWDGPTMAAFAEALGEAAAHCPAPPDERKP